MFFFKFRQFWVCVITTAMFGVLCHQVWAGDSSGTGQNDLTEAISAGDVSALNDSLAQGYPLDSEDENGNTLLLTAILSGQEKIAQILIEKGADVNVQPHSHGLSPLMVASVRAMENVVPVIIAHGARVNATGKRGQTALYLATFSKKSKIVQDLLEAGADPNLADEQNQGPLYLATLKGEQEMVRMLLDKGADVHIKAGELEHSALMAAAIRGEYEIAEMLMEKGALFHIQDKQGMTALMFAGQHGHADIVNLMLGRYAHPMITPFVESMEDRNTAPQ